jgi:hypothetical protein
MNGIIAGGTYTSAHHRDFDIEAACDVILSWRNVRTSRRMLGKSTVTKGDDWVTYGAQSKIRTENSGSTTAARTLQIM